MAGALVVGLAVAGPSATARAQGTNPSSPESLRTVLLGLADALATRPEGAEPARRLREKVVAADDQTLEYLYQGSTQWWRLQQAVATMAGGDGGADAAAALRGTAAPAPAFSSTLPTGPFPPAYPTGSEYDVFRATLPGLGGLSDTNGDGSLDDERCDANFEAGVAIATAVFNFASIAIDLGCHALPELTDIPCFAAAEIVAIGKEASATVEAQCALMDGSVDATEIEAAYENTVRLFENLDAHHAGLAEHDAEVQAALAQHDTDIKNVLSVHDVDIKNVLSVHDGDIKTAIALHDAEVKAALALHDAEIKALLATLQGGVNEANQRLKVNEALNRQIIKLLLTPEGRKAVDPAVLSCTGDDCPRVLDCPGAQCSFPIR
jgi:hypothetical protein